MRKCLSRASERSRDPFPPFKQCHPGPGSASRSERVVSELARWLGKWSRWNHGLIVKGISKATPRSIYPISEVSDLGIGRRVLCLGRTFPPPLGCRSEIKEAALWIELVAATCPPRNC